MMISMPHHPIGLSLVLWSSSSLATPLPLQILTEGSATEEDASTLPPLSPTTTSCLPHNYQTTTGGQTDVETAVLDQVGNFLHSNMLFILIGAMLLLLVLFIICSAVLVSRRWRINAYYPSSFPSKMYVEQRDKVGGAKHFDEVPQKPSKGTESDPLDSSKQLQADIMRAAKSLRTPSKPHGEGEEVEPCQNTSDRTLDEEQTNPCEPSERCELWGNGVEIRNQEQPQIPLQQISPEEVETEEFHSETDPDHRPSSQLAHCDSPSLQLITGEKTAF